MKRNPRIAAELQGPLLIAFAALLWGTTGVAAQVLFTTSDIQPLGLAFLRLAIACPCFLLLSRVRGEHRRPIRHGAGRRWLILLGLAQGGYQVTYLVAVQLTGAGVATLIALCLAPVFVAIVAVPLLNERLPPAIVVSLIAALTGTALLALEHGLGVAGSWMTGVVTALGAAMIYAGFTLASRHTAGLFAPFQTAFVCFFTGALAVLPIALVTHSLQGLDRLSLHGVVLVLYVGLVTTCLSYVCFFQGMRTTTATQSSIIVTLEPLFAAVLAWVVLGETMTAYGVVGALVLIAAVIVAVLPARRRASVRGVRAEENG